MNTASLASNCFKTQLESVVFNIQQMDISSVADLLEENHAYQNFPKDIFLQKLDKAFSEFKNHGDTFLHCFAGCCNHKSCSYKSRGFSFIGNNSKHFMNLIVDMKDGVVQDIFECAIFKTDKAVVEKKNRVFIHELKIDELYLPLPSALSNDKLSPALL